MMWGVRRVCAEASLVLALASIACIVLSNVLNSQSRSYEYQGLAVAGLIVLAPVATALGAFGRRVPGDLTGASCCARIGFILGTLTCGLACVLIGLPQGSGVSEKMEFRSNIRQVALALANYELVEGRLPPAVVRDPRGRPLYSWRVLILPYLREYAVHEGFHLNEPWDSPHNKPLLTAMPLVFERPGDDSFREGMTAIEAVSGPGTAFEDGGQPFKNPDGSSNVPDGLDQTVLLVEIERSVPWTSPSVVEIGPGPGLSLPPLGGGYPRFRPWIGPNPQPTRFKAAFADLEVRDLPRSLAHDTLRALFTRNGGEPVPVSSP